MTESPDRRPDIARGRPAPTVRITDHERAQVERLLRLALNDGSLDLAELDRRLATAYAANTREELAAVTAEAGQLELRLSDQLADVFRRYEVARQRVEAFRVRVLPRARESVRLVRIGYASGDPKYNYTTLLQSQQVLFQSEVLSVEALGEAWRTAAELGGLLQWEQFSEFLSK